MDIPFVPGIELSRGFYRDLVAPVLGDAGLIHSAALIGSGSEVLGFDDETSRDHHWGPRVMIFVAAEDRNRIAGMSERLADTLPLEYRGYSTNFSQPDPNDNGVQLLQPVDAGPVNHRVAFSTLPDYIQSYLGLDVRCRLEPVDWLTISQQKLRSLVAGEVFHDDLPPEILIGGLAAGTARNVDSGILTTLRETFAWYPDEIWRYLLAAGWARIGQEEHLMGRAGQVGDEIGSALIGARLVRDVMRLALLMEREYAPYPKWFGTAFSRLECAAELKPSLSRVLGATDWKGRDNALVEPYRTLARMHNRLCLTRPMPEEVRDFWGRPFQVMAMHGYSEALLETIRGDWLTNVLRRSPVGSIDQISDNTDFLEDSALRPSLADLLRHADR